MSVPIAETKVHPIAKYEAAVFKQALKRELKEAVVVTQDQVRRALIACAPDLDNDQGMLDDLTETVWALITLDDDGNLNPEWETF